MSLLRVPRKSPSTEESNLKPNDFQSLESRKRQNKKDDAIRRKIGNNLNKKKQKGITKLTKLRKFTPGTVLSLKPSDAIICKEFTTIYEASQLMIAKRENCILVVNGLSELIGIFTAKDLAFRVVASNLNPNLVTANEIMTPNPLCVNSHTQASEALNLMVQKGFRHLPILDDNNQIVGVLDITKCFAQQMEKLERMHDSSKKLHEALEYVQSKTGLNQQPLQVLEYLENLKIKMNGPTLKTVLGSKTTPIYTSVKSSVYDATALMKKNNTTAILVKDLDDKVIGIFTSKDVVLRIISTGLDPKKSSIIRFMTPKPDVANINLPVQQALRQMFDGNYLNLPVIDDKKGIVGIVDVLKLTYATLNQIKKIESVENSNNKNNDNTSPTLSITKDSNNQQISSENVAWNKFWCGFNEDSESIHSESITCSGPYIATSELNSINLDIKPSDSISHIDSHLESVKSPLTLQGSQFTFKFKSPSIENRVYRVSFSPSEGIEKLRLLINEKLTIKDFEILKLNKSIIDESNENSENYAISYIDDEGDIISITSNSDLFECVKINIKTGNNKVDLYLHNSHDPAPVDINKIKIDKSKLNSIEIIKGIPNEVLIPSALVLLASFIIIGFVFKKK